MNSSFTAWPLKMGPRNICETSVTSYESMLCDMPQVWRLYGVLSLRIQLISVLNLEVVYSQTYMLFSETSEWTLTKFGNGGWWQNLKLSGDLNCTYYGPIFFFTCHITFWIYKLVVFNLKKLEHDIYIYIYAGKQWQTTPKNLPRMKCARAIPITWLSSGSCQPGL